MSIDAGAAAAARLASTAERLDALRERARQLHAGLPVSLADVLRARAWAEAQRAETRRAAERLSASHRAAADRHGVVAEMLAAAGKKDQAARFRLSARAHADAALDPAWPEGRVGGGSPANGSDTDTSPLSSRRAIAANRRLRAMVTALGSSRGDALAAAPSRALWQALVDQCSAEHWQGWSHAVCEVATARLPTVAGTAISSYDQTISDPIAASDAWTESVEEIQQLLGEGPSLTAQVAQRSVMVADLTSENERWPVYVGAVATTGVRSVCAIPLRLDGGILGVISFYRKVSGPLTADEWSEAAAIADAAVTALMGDADDLEDGRLPGATKSALLIHVAAGVLAARMEISPAEALDRLRAHAFASNRRLRAVAEQVVAGRPVSM